MATAKPRTLQTLQDSIHSELEGDSTTPSTSDDEWSYRLRLINDLIEEWEDEVGVFWDDLWVTGASLATIAVGDSDYDLPEAFREPGGYVEIWNGAALFDRIPLVKSHQLQTFDVNKRVAYITGNEQDGHVLNLNWAPATGDQDIGYKLKMPYYKRATVLAATTDQPEMSKPLFLVHGVVAQEHLINEFADAYTVHARKADSLMKSMKRQNNNWQPYGDFGIENPDGIAFGT